MFVFLYFVSIEWERKCESPLQHSKVLKNISFWFKIEILSQHFRLLRSFNNKICSSCFEYSRKRIKCKVLRKSCTNWTRRGLYSKCQRNLPHQPLNLKGRTSSCRHVLKLLALSCQPSQSGLPCLRVSHVSPTVSFSFWSLFWPQPIF